MALAHKVAVADACQCGAASGVPCDAYALQNKYEAGVFVFRQDEYPPPANGAPLHGVSGWSPGIYHAPASETPFFGVDRSPAAQMETWRRLRELSERPLRWFRFRRWLARLVVRALRVDPDGL